MPEDSKTKKFRFNYMAGGSYSIITQDKSDTVTDTVLTSLKSWNHSMILENMEKMMHLTSMAIQMPVPNG